MRWKQEILRRDDSGPGSDKLVARSRRRQLAWVAMALVIGMAGATTPAAALSVGDKLSTNLVLGSKQIPLPIGEWVVAGLGTQPFTMPALGAFGTIQTAVLFLTRGDQIDALLEVNTNTIPVNDGWGRTKSCSDTKQFLLLTRYKTGWETSCAFVEMSRFGAASAGPPAWEQARDFARQAKLAMPNLWLTAGFRVSDRQDLIDARFHFNPELMLGASAASMTELSDWSSDAVKQDPLRLGAIQVVSSWVSGFDTWIEMGLRNQITRPPGPMPEVAAYTTTSPHVDMKLLDLERLYRDGQISWAAYQAQSQKAISEVPVYQQQTSLLSNSVKKNISFRTLGTMVDYAIAYVVTANNAVSWGIALTINSTDSVWFVLNDQYWDDYYAKLNTHDSERMVDFIYIGGGVKA
jgi:uncharacterized membrane protein